MILFADFLTSANRIIYWTLLHLLPLWAPGAMRIVSSGGYTTSVCNQANQAVGHER